jgi:hypothetical protein
MISPEAGEGRLQPFFPALAPSSMYSPKDFSRPSSDEFHDPFSEGLKNQKYHVGNPTSREEKSDNHR